MNTTSEILHQCTADAFTGTITFLETIQRMAAAGVRWYSANLEFGMKTHYLNDGTAIQVKWPEWTPLQPCPAFDRKKVVAAIQASQQRQIIYPQFLKLIAEAGVAVYTVHLQGCKAIYLGADGDFHVEQFPQ